jgi:predicted nuclease with TOPRIM domain
VQQNIQNINQGLTEAQVNQLIDSRAYVTQNEVQNLVVQQVQQINPGVGLTEAQVNQLIDAKTGTFTTLPIVQTWVNGQNFLSQNQMIAWVNSQSYTTLPAVQTWVLDQDYVNATDVQNMINTSMQNAGGGGGLDTNAVNALIDARAYLNQNAIQALINASVAVVQNALNALTVTVNQHSNQIQTINANLVTLSDKDTFLQTKINDLTVQYNDLNAKYTTLNDQHLALQANFNAQQATITQLNTQLTALSAQFTTLNTQVTTLNTQVTTLNTQVTTLSNQTTTPAVPEIVGVSGATNGRISFNGKNGIQGATELCKASFANSHACSISEAHSAISANKYPANIVGTQTWVSDPTLEVANHFSAANAFTGTKFCQSLQYNSGDVATGTTMQIRSYTSGGGGGGLAGFHLAFSNVGCGSSFSIMCCK